MLSKQQKEKLRRIHIYESSSKEKNGVPIIEKRGSQSKIGKLIEGKMVVPSSYQLVDSVIAQILECGFSKVERVAPSDANCIIRVFQKLHYEYDRELIFNIYGADCFVREYFAFGDRFFSREESDWLTTDLNDETFSINFSKCSISEWLCQDEKVIIEADFFDIYVRVS